MTCASGAVNCASAQSDPSSLSACRNLGPLATHRVRTQTDQTASIHVDLNLPWAPSHFVGFVMRWLIWLNRRNQQAVLRKHTYSNILKILPPKNENFQMKNSNIFHISAQNIDCGYSLEPPR